MSPTFNQSCKSPAAMRALCSFVEYRWLMLSSRPVTISFSNKRKFVVVWFLSTTFSSASRPSQPAWRECREMLQSHTAKVLHRRSAPEGMYLLDSFCIHRSGFKAAQLVQPVCNQPKMFSTTCWHLLWVLSLVLSLALSFIWSRA